MDITELSKELIEQIRNGASESDVIQLLADNYHALQLLQPDVIKSVCLNCGKPIEQHSPYTRMCPDKVSHYEQTVL